MRKENGLVQSRIPVAAPVLDGRETEYVLECLTTSWISSNGRLSPSSRKPLRRFVGSSTRSRRTTGPLLYTSRSWHWACSPATKSLFQALTYIASANAVRYCNAKPVFVDNDIHTFNMDPDEVAAKITSRTKAHHARTPVRPSGRPRPNSQDCRKSTDYSWSRTRLKPSARNTKGRTIGGHGTCATFSFFGNKIITTGEGGMVTTNDDELAARLRLFRGQGVDPRRKYWFPVIGYNYRMTNIAAAIGLAQLERIDSHLSTRKKVADGYHRRLAHLSDRIALPMTENWAEHAYWMYTVLLQQTVRKDRDRVMQDLDDLGIETRPVFYPLHILPPYRDHAQGPFPRAEFCGARGINLPTHGRLTDQDIDRVADALSSSIA